MPTQTDYYLRTSILGISTAAPGLVPNMTAGRESHRRRIMQRFLMLLALTMIGALTFAPATSAQIDPCPDPDFPRATPDGCQDSDLPDVEGFGSAVAASPSATASASTSPTASASSSASASEAASASAPASLPVTGGASLFALGSGALLVGGGLLTRIVKEG